MAAKSSQKKKPAVDGRTKLTSEARRWLLNELAWGNPTKEICKGLLDKHEVEFDTQAVYGFTHRNREHIEARQADLSRELYRYPIAHAYFRFDNLRRIFDEARADSDYNTQLKCMEQAASEMDRIETPEMYGSKKEAEAFLETVGCGQAHSGCVQKNK